MAAVLAERVRENCKLYKDGNPKIYRITPSSTEKWKEKRIARYEIGKKNSAYPSPGKVLILVGETGAGKSTLINSIANYYLGVRWEYAFRFVLITDEEEGGKSQARSQTSWITAYVFNKVEGSGLDFTLTVIDTPGFGDTEGLERDKAIAAQLKDLFSTPGGGGVDQLHAVGFVAQAPLVRLTPTQKYIFDSVLAIFAKDIEKNIFLLATWADGQPPAVAVAATEAKIPFRKAIKFNNSGLYSPPAEEDDEAESFDRMYWRMGKKSFDLFFKELEQCEARSLQLTKEVLNEREHLEATVQGLQPQVRLWLSKVDVLKQEQSVLEMHEVQINENKKFDYDITIVKQRKVDLPKGHYVTNCLTCNKTCHYPCKIANDKEKFNCAAMLTHDPEAVCGNCNGNCSWKLHVNNPYRFDLYEDVERRTSEDLKKRYEMAVGGKAAAQKMIQQMELDVKELQTLVLNMIIDIQRCLKRLDEIALKPNPLTEIGYIDLLIETEKQEAKAGYMKRIQYYQKVRDEAKLLSGVKDANPAEHKSKMASLWQKFKNLFP